MEPPIQTEYFRSGGAMILIFIVGVVRGLVISFCILSAIPGYMVVPPERTSVGVEILTDVHVALHDGVVGCFVNASLFHSEERRLEH